MRGLSFSYSITRPYPYPWFKWVVVIGGVCMTILFSSLNLAAAGYELTVEYTFDPNKTVSQKRWTQNFPFSLVGRATASCQSQELAVNSQLYSDKLSLAYNIADIWQVQNDNQILNLPSLKYTNNPLQNCSISLIEIDLDSYSARTAAQMGWAQWGFNALGLVTCAIDNDGGAKAPNNIHGPTWFNLTVNYEFVTPTIESGAAFRFLHAPDQNRQASLWWGESLLSWYWLNLVSAMRSHATFSKNTVNIVKGSVGLRPSPNITDISLPDFFLAPSYHFITNFMDSGGNIQGEPNCCLNTAGNQTTIGGLHAEAVQPDIWIEVDSFAKVFYSTILSDLGQNSSTNILTSPSLLTTFTTNITSMAAEGGVESQWLKAGPARAPYSQVEHETGALGVTPSVVYTQYLCQVPTLKSGGSLFISVLLADLVFLQAAWVLLNWITVMRLDRRDPTAQYCTGCSRSLTGDDTELKALTAGTTTAAEPLPHSTSPMSLHERNISSSSADAWQRLL